MSFRINSTGSVVNTSNLNTKEIENTSDSINYNPNLRKMDIPRSSTDLEHYTNLILKNNKTLLSDVYERRDEPYEDDVIMYNKATGSWVLVKESESIFFE